MDLERIKCIRKAINEDKMGIEGISRMLALIPCWAIVNCSEKDRKNCEAFDRYTKPCWTTIIKIIFAKKIAGNAKFTTVLAIAVVLKKSLKN